jgi:hypothetical protein
MIPLSIAHKITVNRRYEFRGEEFPRLSGEAAVNELASETL